MSAASPRPGRSMSPTPDGCTAETVRCADARDYNAELRPCCRAHIVEMSRRIAEAFDAAGVTYWIDYGTLLGAVRNPMTTWADYPWLPQEGRPAGPLAPGIVPHDKDGDWGVLYSDWKKANVALARSCPDLYRLMRAMSASIKVRVSKINKTNIDLFFWLDRPKGDRRAGRMYRRRYAQVDSNKGKEFQRSDLFPLQRIEWEGLMLPAPKDPEAWLAFRYGDGWRTPIAANNDGVARK